MCIACKNREMLADVTGQIMDMSAALIDAFQLIERLKAKGTALDATEQQCYDRLSAFVKAGDEPATVAQAGEVPEGLKEALQSVFPGATIIVGSPDEVEAMLDKTLKGDKKPH